MVAIHVSGLRIRAGGEVLLDDLDLDVGAGERFVLLGASGSGKTLLLRVLAGLDRPAAGLVRIHGRQVQKPRPDVTMVFQGDATYEHLDVEGNLGISLRFAPEATGSVDAAARRFMIRRLLGRRPATLSAGQRKAVVAARALVRDDVSVVLMDEPLVGTDPHRRSLVVDSVLDDRSLTVVIATNEPGDAFRWGDRVGVLAGGRLAQVGSPGAVYRDPISLSVADITGDLNRFPATLEREDGWWARIAGSRVRLGAGLDASWDGRPAVVGLRPRDLEVASPGAPFERTVHATVGRIEHLGSRQRVLFGLGAVAGIAFMADIDVTAGVAAGNRVSWYVDPASIRLFDPNTGRAIPQGRQVQGAQGPEPRES